MKFNFKEQYLKEIELPIWADPQSDVILEKSRDYCHIYFGCWEEHNKSLDTVNYIGKLTLKNAWAVKSMDVEFYDIFTQDKDYKYKSSICIVENSEWLEEMTKKREKYYPNYKNWDKRDYKHFHFKGHDNYFDIIAEDFAIDKIRKDTIKHYQKLWNQ